MSVQPPSLDNGYLWLCGMVMRSAQARQLIGKLSTYIRYQMNWRDLSKMEPASFYAHIEIRVHLDDYGKPAAILREMKPASFYETHIEIWVHPDDYEKAAAILREVQAV
jgi:hypothetical protein